MGWLSCQHAWLRIVRRQRHGFPTAKCAPLYERPLPVCRLSDGGAAGLLVVGPTRLLGLTFAPLCSAASMSFAQLAGRVAHERRTTHAPARGSDKGDRLRNVPHKGVLGRASTLICPIPARASRSSSAGRP